MENIKEIIAENLVKLRKQHKLTQLELAEKINFSDKAISRWEKGEVTPDIETLISLCELYKISINDLLTKQTEPKNLTKRYHFELKNKMIISCLAVLLVWFAATMVFLYGGLISNVYLWKAFIWAIPTSCVVALIFNAIWGKRKWIFIIITLLIWSLLASVYIQFLPTYNLYLIFILGVPLQVATVLWSLLKPKSK